MNKNSRKEGSLLKQLRVRFRVFLSFLTITYENHTTYHEAEIKQMFYCAVEQWYTSGHKET